MIEGFVLDVERVYSTAARFVAFCNGSLEMAVRQSIHQQIIAHMGGRSIRAAAGL